MQCCRGWRCCPGSSVCNNVQLYICIYTFLLWNRLHQQVDASSFAACSGTQDQRGRLRTAQGTNVPMWRQEMSRGRKRKRGEINGGEHRQGEKGPVSVYEVKVLRTMFLQSDRRTCAVTNELKSKVCVWSPGPVRGRETDLSRSSEQANIPELKHFFREEWAKTPPANVVLLLLSKYTQRRSSVRFWVQTCVTLMVFPQRQWPSQTLDISRLLFCLTERGATGGDIHPGQPFGSEARAVQQWPLGGIHWSGHWGIHQ